MNDKLLIDQVLKGNKSAFKLLVVRYQRPLFSFFKKFGFPSQKVEELVQDVFLKSFQSLESYQSEKGSFSSWIFSIAKHHAINELKRRGEFLEDEKILEKIYLEDSIENSSESLLDKKISYEIIHDHVAKIPNPFKIPIILSYINELSLDEIASIENCSVNTVKSRIFRGKLFLKKMLSKEFV